MTVKDLIEALQTLPPEAEVWEATWCTNKPMNLAESDWPTVYQRDGVTRLYFDDGEGYRADVDPYSKTLIEFAADAKLGEIMAGAGFTKALKR